MPWANEFTGPNGKDISFNTQVMSEEQDFFFFRSAFGRLRYSAEMNRDEWCTTHLLNHSIPPAEPRFKHIGLWGSVLNIQDPDAGVSKPTFIQTRPAYRQVPLTTPSPAPVPRHKCPGHKPLE